MANGTDTSILARLGYKLSANKISDSVARLSTGKRNIFGGDSASQSLANTLNATSKSQFAAGNNLRDGLAALSIAETSLNEISTLTARLAEIGTLNTNNTLLSTNDIAALNKETAEITTAIDAIVAGTKFNGVAMLGTSDISLSIGASPDGTNALTITIGGISAVASVTAASSATSTAATLKTTVATDLGQVSGATQASNARQNVAYTAESILAAAADTIETVDYAAETARLTKNAFLNKISISLVAQANSIDYSKLDLLS